MTTPDPGVSSADSSAAELLDSHPESGPDAPPRLGSNASDSSGHPAPPVAGRPPTTADQAWLALAAELTPPASLTRVDAATTRVVTSITVIGSLLTGFGVVGASTSSVHGLARTLVAVAVGVSALSVVTALAAQVLTVSRALRPGNLLEVKAWYRNVFARRARLAQAATVLLVVAGLVGGVAGVLIVARPSSAPSHPGSTVPSMAVERIQTPDGNENVTLQLTFRGLKPGVPIHASISGTDTSDDGDTDGGDDSGDGSDSEVVVADAVTFAGADGAASIALVASAVSAGLDVHVRAAGGGRTCQALFSQSDADPTLTCTPR